MLTLTSDNTLVSALYRTEAVVVSLQARGVEVKGIVVREGQPVIRIQRHAMCDYLLTSGKASYIEYGQGNRVNTARAFSSRTAAVSSGQNHSLKEKISGEES
jgi:hypothetical protein